MYSDKAEAMLVGNLTRDVEVNETQTGKRVAHFDVAVSRGKNDWSEFFRCTAWEERVGVVEDLNKGDRVELAGNLRHTKPYQNKNGQEVRDFEVVVRDVKKVDD